MREQFSRFALAASLGLALAFTFSCSDGNDGSQIAENNQVYWQGDDKPYARGDLTIYMEVYDCINLRDIHLATDELYRMVDSIAMTSLQSFLSKPSSSGIAEFDGNLVVCDNANVKTRIQDIKEGIADYCSEMFVSEEDRNRCIETVTRHASSRPDYTDYSGGVPTPGSPEDLASAIREGRVLYILERTLERKLMFEVGTISNGKVSLDLPKKVDSHLSKIDEVLYDVEINPLGVEALFHANPLMLMDNSGKHIGNLRYYEKASDTEYHSVYYWYFSENVQINSTAEWYDENEYKIDAKKGWNKIYARTELISNQSTKSYFTTDLSKIPAGLKWIVEELAD